MTSAPLACLADGSLALRFHSWRGMSGRRYVFSVHDIDAALCFDYEDAVVIAASIASDGSRRIELLADTGSLPELILGSSAMSAARRRGASELHVHLLADSEAERCALLCDLLPSASAEPGGEPGERSVFETEFDEMLVRSADIIGVVA